MRSSADLTGVPHFVAVYRPCYIGVVDEVTIQRLSNHKTNVADRVQVGEQLMFMQSGQPVEEPRPVLQPTLGASKILERWCHVPSINPMRFRSDIDALIDPL